MARARGQAAFERGCYRLISLARGDHRVHEAEVERGRIVTPSGEHLFSGRPPAGWKVALDAPALDANAGELCALLARLTEPWRAELHYTAAISRRIAIGGVADGPARELAVWALTGWVSPDGSRSVPVGWSGRGDGLSWLRAGAAGELRAHMAAVTAAAPMAPGRFSAVLSPAAAAVLVHEVGHLAEAQAASGAGRARLGCRIASSLVTMVDDPLHDGPGRYEYDDDNVRVLGATTVVNEGILVSELHSDASAREASTLSTANGRAASAWDPPIPRMSNLRCLPGSIGEDGLVAQIEDGLYLHRLADGISSGERIEARVVLAERLRRGARTNEYLAGGRIEESVGLLERVVGVADNPAFHGNAMCGRSGQLLFNVGTSAPSLWLGALRIVA